MDVRKLFGLSLFREILLFIVRWITARKTIFVQLKWHKKVTKLWQILKWVPLLPLFLQFVTFKEILLLKMPYTKNNPTNEFRLNIPPFSHCSTIRFSTKITDLLSIYCTPSPLLSMYRNPSPLLSMYCTLHLPYSARTILHLPYSACTILHLPYSVCTILPFLS
jgi:hypothetical protein